MKGISEIIMLILLLKVNTLGIPKKHISNLINNKQ